MHTQLNLGVSHLLCCCGLQLLLMLPNQAWWPTHIAGCPKSAALLCWPKCSASCASLGCKCTWPAVQTQCTCHFMSCLLYRISITPSTCGVSGLMRPARSLSKAHCRGACFRRPGWHRCLAVKAQQQVVHECAALWLCCPLSSMYRCSSGVQRAQQAPVLLGQPCV